METIRYQLRDGVGCITLDDGKANVMSVPFFSRLDETLDAAEQDKPATLVFSGRPGMFSGGLDLKLLPTLSSDDLATLVRTFARTLLRVFTFPVPTVAVLTGHAIAGGAMLAFACDRRFAVDGPFRIHVNEVAIGIPLPSWMLLLGKAAIPPRWRTEALLHARAYSPAEASKRGIVDGLIPVDEDAVAKALESCADLATLSLDAYAESKRRLRSRAAEGALSLLENELPGR